jgi:hypothetical protein
MLGGLGGPKRKLCQSSGFRFTARHYLFHAGQDRVSKINQALANRTRVGARRMAQDAETDHHRRRESIDLGKPVIERLRDGHYAAAFFAASFGRLTTLPGHSSGNGRHVTVEPSIDRR